MRSSKSQLTSGLKAEVLFANRVETSLLEKLHNRLLDYLNSEEFINGIPGANRVYATVHFGEFDLTENVERLRAELTKL